MSPNQRGRPVPAVVLALVLVPGEALGVLSMRSRSATIDASRSACLFIFIGGTSPTALRERFAIARCIRVRRMLSGPLPGLERLLGLVEDEPGPGVNLAGLGPELIVEVGDRPRAAEMASDELGFLVEREVPAGRVQGTRP